MSQLISLGAHYLTSALGWLDANPAWIFVIFLVVMFIILVGTAPRAYRSPT